MKLFAALGPGDIIAAREARLLGGAGALETSIMFSEQLIELCQLRKIQLLAISSNQRSAVSVTGTIRLENQPRGFETSRGILFHLSRVGRAVYLAARAYRFKADVALIDSGSAHYFALSLFRLVGIKVGVNLHNVLWPSGFPPTGRSQRIFMLLDSLFFRNLAHGVLGVSPECGRQVSELSAGEVPFFEYRAQYSKRGLPIKAEVVAWRPFRILYAGRIEVNKGVFDLVEIARRVNAKSEGPILFDVCGGGPALEDLKLRIRSERLDHILTIHGRLQRPDLLDKYMRSHAVIVPTRSDFCEGLPQVCAEAMICGKPLITSRVSNALDVLAGAIEEAKTDDVDSYVDAILRISEDSSRYAKLAQRTKIVREQFFDRSFSYPAAVDRFLGAVMKSWKPCSSYDQLFTALE